MNYLNYPHVVKIAKKYKAYKIWTDRYLPKNKSDDLILQTEQFKKLGALIWKEKHKNKHHSHKQTDIAANRALQFLFCGGKPYFCSAGDSLLAILANGDILPCRRLPIKIGNILSDNLIDIYKNSNTLNNIRNKNNLDDNCFECYYKTICNGGLKCLSYSLTGNYKKKDVNCWM